MNIEVLKIVGQVAGIGGIALGVFLILFKDIIRKNIFPSLTKEQAYRLLRLILVLVWSIAVLGIAAWTYTSFLHTRNVVENPIADGTTGIALGSARLLESETPNKFFLEVIVENGSRKTVPVNNLILDAQQWGGFACAFPEPSNPWQDVVLDWHRILYKRSNEATQGGWTTLKDEKIRIISHFKLASCGDYDHHLKAIIPIQVDLEPNKASRILLAVTEENSDELKPFGITQLATWNISISFDDDLPISPKEIRVKSSIIKV